MVEHFPVAINTKSIQYLLIKTVQNYAKKMAYRLSWPGKSKKIVANYEIDDRITCWIYDDGISEQLFAENQAKRQS